LVYRRFGSLQTEVPPLLCLQHATAASRAAFARSSLRLKQRQVGPSLLDRGDW
jgi:hypothetical protein